MSYFLGQTDPIPPPMRPVSWPTILGWAAVVGVALAVFNGTISLKANRRRTPRRNSLRSLRWAESGLPKRKHAKKGKRRTSLEMLDARISLHGLAHGRRSSSHALFAAWEKKYGRRHALRRNAYPAWKSSYSNEDFDRAQQYAQELTDADRRDGRPAPKYGYSAERIAQATREVRDANVYSDAAQRRRTTRNTGRRSSHARPKPAKMSELGVWEAIGTVRDAHPREHLDVLPPGVAAKFKKLAPGLYKYGHGAKGEAIVRFKNATLKGAMTSTRIGASKVGAYHWVIDNFDPSFPVVVRGIDDRGRSYFRIEEYAKRFERVPAMVRRKAAER